MLRRAYSVIMLLLYIPMAQNLRLVMLYGRNRKAEILKTHMNYELFMWVPFYSEQRIKHLRHCRQHILPNCFERLPDQPITGFG